MLGIIGALRACMSCIPCMGISPANGQIHPASTPEERLLAAIRTKNEDAVREVIASFDAGQTLSLHARNYIYIFLTEKPNASHSNFAIKKDLLNFLVEQNNATGAAVINHGEAVIEHSKAMVALGQTIVDRGQTLLQMIQENDPECAKLVDESFKHQEEEFSTVTADLVGLADDTMLGALYGRGSSNTLTAPWNTRAGSVEDFSSQKAAPPQLSTREIAEGFVPLPKIKEPFTVMVVDDKPAVVKMHFIPIQRKANEIGKFNVIYVDNPKDALAAALGKEFTCAGTHTISPEETDNPRYVPIKNAFSSKEIHPPVKLDLWMQDFDLGKSHIRGPRLVADYRAIELTQNETNNCSARMKILAFSTDINTTGKPIQAEDIAENFDGIVNKGPGSVRQTLEAFHRVLGDEYIEMPPPEAEASEEGEERSGANSPVSF